MSVSKSSEKLAIYISLHATKKIISFKLSMGNKQSLRDAASNLIFFCYMVQQFLAQFRDQ